MKGLFYAISICFIFAITACSEAEFTDIASSTQKGQGEGLVEDNVPVAEVSEEELDDYVDYYECSEQKKRSCGPHGEEAFEVKGAKKALVCHVPSGNPERRHEICISVNALKAHINRHGRDGILDYFGPCDGGDGSFDD